MVIVLPSFSLTALRKDGESSRVEFKSGSNSELREAVCSLANDLEGSGQPGFLIVGLLDDGSPANIRIDDALMQKFAQIRTDGMLQPLPSLTIEKIGVDGCDVAVIEVQPTDDAPMRYKGRIWVRVGPTTLVASPQDERRLTERRREGNRPFDHSTVDTSLRDLNLAWFERQYLPAAFAPDILERNERTIDEQLQSLRMAVKGRPTIAGVIVLSDDPRRYVPGAYVQFAHFAGSDITSAILDQKVLVGKIADVLNSLREILAINNRVALSIGTGPTDVKRPAYPVAALHELAVNAVLHRTYDASNAPVRVYFFEDRVEISNPGGLYGAARTASFELGGRTDYRNPILADALKTLGFAQHFGLGIPYAKRLLSENGNPPPVFNAEPEALNVTVESA